MTVERVDVWFVALTGEIPMDRLRPVLPGYARERPAQTAPQRERMEANAALALICAAAAGAPAVGAVWRQTPRGQPVAPHGMRVSLSHASGVAAVAIGRDAAVGVDVERRDRVVDIDGLARDVLDDDELQAWRREPGGRRKDAFLRLWTRKEAVLKALGVGLAGDLRAVVTSGHGRIRSLPPACGDPASWTVRDLPVPGGNAGAVAVRAPHAVVRTDLTSLAALLEACDG
jgi:4'-phosphopantetheinyl transferase